MRVTSDRPRLALFAVSSVLVMMSFGVAVLNVALPELVRDLGATTADLQWILNAYPLVYAGLLLTGATLGDRVGRARTLEVGLVIFGALSAAAAFAPTPLTLILARGALGAAAAFVTPMTLSIATTLFDDPRERSRAIGVWAGMGSLGMAIGPVIGGVLLSGFWWGSLFLLNVPFCAVLLVATHRWVPESRDPTPGRFDPLGMILSFAGLTGLVWAVIGAPAHGWASTETLGVGALSVAMLAVFVEWELRTAHPMLELSYLRDPWISAAAIVNMGGTFVFAGTLLVVSLLLPSVLGHGPMAVGLRLAPMALAMLVAAAGSARVTARVGADRAIALGMLASAVGVGGLAAFRVGDGYGLVLVATLVLGAGLGLGTTQAIEATMTAVPPEKAGFASGFGATTRQVAQILGVAVFGSVVSSRYRSQLDETARTLVGGRAARQRSLESLARALEVAHHVGGSAGRALADAARHAFVSGMRAAAIGGAVTAVVGATVALRYLPARDRRAAASVTASSRTTPATRAQ